ncbi:Essential protein Yae1, N terminal [Maublancomyces gigas]|uniref:Protein YAE1 n=1 Tax=Discina gigas TaxID=1032678 RepID=A0ABR3GYF7_9PEZI
MYLNTPLPHTSAAPTQQHTDLFGDDDAASPPSESESESRDMARLRRTHTTQGYRDGIARGKSTHLQDGFDEGYSLGGRFGLLTGWVLGVAEGLRDEKLRAEAAAGLALEKIFAREYFDETGVWKYDVGVGEEETLDRVVERHPVVVRWVGRVKEEARRRGLEVGGLGEGEGGS